MSALALIGSLLCAEPATAQQQINYSPEYDAAFKAMLSDPGNLDKTFAFAGEAIKAGDLEGAVAALERMLFINPNLPRIQLELGALYFRLGSYEAARAYFLTVKDDPNAPAEVKTKVDSFLAEIDNRQKRHKWSGSVFAGVRWQSNANTASADGVVSVQGVASTLDSQFTQKKDWNAFAAVSAKHTYQMDQALPDTWDTSITTFGSRQAAQKTVDVSLGEITTGPSLKIFPGNDYDLTFRPYGLITYVAIDDVRDFFSPGAGASLTATLNPLTLAELTTEWRDKRYRNSFKSPSKSDRDGLERALRARIVRVISEDLSINLGGSLTKQETQADAQGSFEYSWSFGAAWNFDSPIDKTMPRWTLIGSVTRAFTPYETQDATIDPNITRFDKDWRFSVTQAIPINKDWTVIAMAARTIRSSSLPNYQYTNNAMTLGVSYRF
ncbi:tetratricopeptide repeat protein [Ferrovibrio sp.]|uniref:tetratricopeptide repeat protein n=1 Tax=Ferrovibrio sp. TaxID=1917215 RepID=UPI003D148F04